jgi:long-chain acyl-CoA synthetase
MARLLGADEKADLSKIEKRSPSVAQMFDAGGFLRITDRKKDMFKTAQDKYVAPSAIASRFEGMCPYVGELIVFGEGRPYCVALVSLDTEAITAWAEEHGLAGKSFAEIARHDKTRDLIGGYIEALNQQLNSWEQVKRFAIIDRELSIEAGDLTPSLKLRRKVVLAEFADQLAALYT